MVPQTDRSQAILKLAPEGVGGKRKGALQPGAGSDNGPAPG